MRPSALALSALAIVGAAASLAGYVTLRPAPAPAVTPAPAGGYSLHGFDLAGDGYPVTYAIGLSLAECESQAEHAHGTYVYVCRPDDYTG